MSDQSPWLNRLHVIGFLFLSPLIVAAIALLGKWILGLWTTEPVSYWGLLLGVIAIRYWVPFMEKKVRALNRQRYLMRQSRKNGVSTVN